MYAIEQYPMKQRLPTGKGRRIVKILRPFFLTSTAFVSTKAYSEMFCFCKTWNNVLTHIVKYLALLDVKWNLPTSAQADISHLRSKYFTAKRFHLPVRANFVAYLLYGRYACCAFFLYVYFFLYSLQAYNFMCIKSKKCRNVSIFYHYDVKKSSIIV